MINEVFFEIFFFRDRFVRRKIFNWIQLEESQGSMPPFLTNVLPSGQQEPSSIQAQNNSLVQVRTNRNCKICGDMASGFNLNVPRYVSDNRIFSFNSLPNFTLKSWEISRDSPAFRNYSQIIILKLLDYLLHCSCGPTCGFHIHRGLPLP